MPTTDDGYYSATSPTPGSTAGRHHFTIDGHAKEPRVALMMAGLIKRVIGRQRLGSPDPPRGYRQNRPSNEVEPLRLTSERWMTVRDLLTELQHLPRDLEVLAFEAG